MKYEKVEVRLTEQEKLQLKIYAATKSKTMSDIIRDALKNVMLQEDYSKPQEE